MANSTRNDFFSLLEVARFGVCVANASGEIIYWNRRAEEITGISVLEALGKRSHDLIRALATYFASRLPDPREALDTTAGPAAVPTHFALVPVAFADLADCETLVAYLFDATFASATTGSIGSTASAFYAPHDAAADTTAGFRVGQLSPRETEVLRHLAAGVQTDHIAQLLDISVHTVRNHIRGLRTKLGARTKLDAVVIAMREGLL